MTIIKIPAGRMRGNIGQGFGVEIMYPGLSLTPDDSGIGPIGRIDRAQVQPGHLIGMHPHTHFMMMNAGHAFQHEELMLGDNPVRALQIFLRPNAADLEPVVQFHEFPEENSVDSWRLIAGPHKAPLLVRSDVRVFDALIRNDVQLRLPITDTGRNMLLYVYSGKITLGDQVVSEGESLFLTGFDKHPTALVASDVCYFRSIPKVTFALNEYEPPTLQFCSPRAVQECESSQR